MEGAINRLVHGGTAVSGEEKSLIHLISLKEQSKEDILDILDLAKEIKKKRSRNEPTPYLAGKTMVMLFEKSSTRTWISYDVAMKQMGGIVSAPDFSKTNFSLTEFDIEMRAVMEYADVLVYRAREAKKVLEAASYNKIPVIDACSEKYHPSQALGDILTMAEYSNGVGNIGKVAWLGIENNVMNTLMLACAKLGIEFAIIGPKNYGVDESSVDEELKKMAESTGLVERTSDVSEGLKGAKYIHTDTWMNMEFFEGGKIKPEFNDKYEERKKLFLPYQVNAKLIGEYAPNAKVMHCMPCHIGYEITRDAVFHPNSIIFPQTQNRLHMQKAILMYVLGIGMPRRSAV